MSSAMKNRTVNIKRTARINFVSETVNELKKVVWLSWQETARLTGLVLLVTLAVGLVLGIIDFGFSKLVDVFLVGGP